MLPTHVLQTKVKRKYKNRRSLVWRKRHDRSYVFAQRLVDRLVSRWGMPHVEVERALCALGEEMCDLLASGYAVGLPGCGTVYSRRRFSPVMKKYAGVADGQVVYFRFIPPKYLRKRCWTEHTNKGTMQEQFEREFARLACEKPERKDSIPDL